MTEPVKTPTSELIDNLTNANREVMRKLTRLVGMLQTCSDQFKFYEQQHLSKNTKESTNKAEVNKKLHNDIDNMLREEKLAP